MFYHEYSPPANIIKYIKCFWVLEHDYREKFHTHEHLWADIHTELIFSFGLPYYQREKHKQKYLSKSFAICPFKKELHLHSDGFTGFIAVRFHPWGTFRFFEKPIKQLVDKIVSADELLGENAAIIEQLLMDKPREEKLKILTDFFVSKIDILSEKEIVSQPIAEEIINKKGCIKIKELSEKFSINAKKIERAFVNEIGLSAKLFSRIIRFNNARQLMEQNPDISLSSVAYEIGYADQSHFNKNFRELFGLTPAEFRERITNFNLLSVDSKPDVVFLQDS